MNDWEELVLTENLSVRSSNAYGHIAFEYKTHNGKRSVVVTMEIKDFLDELAIRPRDAYHAPVLAKQVSPAETLAKEQTNEND